MVLAYNLQSRLQHKHELLYPDCCTMAHLGWSLQEGCPTPMAGVDGEAATSSAIIHDLAHLLQCDSSPSEALPVVQAISAAIDKLLPCLPPAFLQPILPPGSLDNDQVSALRPQSAMHSLVSESCASGHEYSMAILHSTYSGCIAMDCTFKYSRLTNMTEDHAMYAVLGAQQLHSLMSTLSLLIAVWAVVLQNWVCMYRLPTGTHPKPVCMPECSYCCVSPCSRAEQGAELTCGSCAWQAQQVPSSSV